MNYFDFQAYNNTHNDRNTFPFIDYSEMGVWILGIGRVSPGSKKKPLVVGIIDEDEDITLLITKAVNEWHINPSELWISEVGSYLAVLQQRGIQV